MQQILTYTFLVLYSVTILGIVLVIITDNRNPLKTLPWIIVLVLAPVVGLVFYFFFGQNLSKQRIISRRMRKRITLQLEEAEHAAGPEIPKAYRPLARLLRTTSHAVPLYGSRITPYTDGSSKMEALLGEIARAQHHIHLQYYIFCDDETGRRLRDALVEKARQGVHVRILYDDVGCSGVRKSFFEGMRREGIEVHAFLHVKFPRFTSKVNYRNHRKIVVIDGRVGFIGGMNIADRYVRGTEWGSWRDTHFRIEGSGVAGLQVAFLSDWSATTKRHVSGLEYFPAAQRYTDNILQIVAGGPLGKWRALLQADSYAVANARRRVWIQTPYYLPSDVLNTALQTAALGGIDVRLMLPARSDSRLIDLASHSYLDDMMRAGVKILRTGVPPLEAADHRRRADRHRIGQHGLPQFRAQLRGERLHIRRRVHLPHVGDLLRRRGSMPCGDPRRVVPPPPPEALGRILHAGLLASDVTHRNTNR